MKRKRVEIEVVGSQHARGPADPAPMGYPGHEVIDSIRAGAVAPPLMREYGLRPWEEPDENGRCLWLLPGEWLDDLPKGALFEAITGKMITFDPDEERIDPTRFGMLSFGIRTRGK